MTGSCLATTTDPTLLIPGSLSALYDDAHDLERLAGALGDASDGVARRVTASWLGRAAARWDERRPQLAASLAAPAQVYRAAAQVLRAHARVIEWAREQVEVAIALWEGGASSAAPLAGPCPAPLDGLGVGLPWTSPLARSLRNQARLATPGPAAVVVGPGVVVRAQAERVLAVLCAAVEGSARSTAEFLDECCAGMPDGQFHLDQVGAGVWDWAWGLGEMAGRFSTPRMLLDWDGFVADGEATVTGSVGLVDQLAENPHDVNRLLLDSETFRDNPARWLGRVAPDAALSVVAGVGVVTKLGRLGSTAARVLDNLADATAGARTARVLDDVLDVVDDVPTSPQGRVDWRDAFAQLPAGSSSGVAIVASESELRVLFESLTEGAERLPSPSAKVPEVFRLDDGTRVQWRADSRSGGATIDIAVPGTRPRKIHVDVS